MPTTAPTLGGMLAHICGTPEAREPAQRPTGLGCGASDTQKCEAGLQGQPPPLPPRWWMRAPKTPHPWHPPTPTAPQDMGPASAARGAAHSVPKGASQGSAAGRPGAAGERGSTSGSRPSGPQTPRYPWGPARPRAGAWGCRGEQRYLGVRTLRPRYPPLHQAAACSSDPPPPAGP
jgi:hypothetical protein